MQCCSVAVVVVVVIVVLKGRGSWVLAPSSSCAASTVVPRKVPWMIGLGVGKVQPQNKCTSESEEGSGGPTA